MDLSKSGKHVLLLESCLASSLKELDVLNSDQSSLTMNKVDLEAAKADVQNRANDLAEQLAQSKVSSSSSPSGQVSLETVQILD